jgi:hypothetical protein
MPQRINPGLHGLDKFVGAPLGDDGQEVSPDGAKPSGSPPAGCRHDIRRNRDRDQIPPYSAMTPPEERLRRGDGAGRGTPRADQHSAQEVWLRFRRLAVHCRLCLQICHRACTRRHQVAEISEE